MASCSVADLTDGARSCIFEGLGPELIKENSIANMTCYFKVAEFFKSALFLQGNEVQKPTKGGEQEVFVCFCHCSGAEMEDLEM